ncbi:MAG: cytochrome c [Terracidiphilus sp.]
MARDVEVSRKRLVFIASLIGIASLAGVSGCSKTLSTSQKRGQAHYSLNCYDCHEENQLGLIKAPPKLHKLFSHHDLPDGATPTTDESVREVIISGKRTMPSFNGRLSGDQIDDIIAYLHSK